MLLDDVAAVRRDRTSFNPANSNRQEFPTEQSAQFAGP
jgi:hypothetical protein